MEREQDVGAEHGAADGEPRKPVSRFALTVFLLSLPASCLPMVLVGRGSHYDAGLGLLSLSMMALGFAAILHVTLSTWRVRGRVLGELTILLGLWTCMLTPHVHHAMPRERQEFCLGSLWTRDHALSMYRDQHDRFPGPDWCDALLDGGYVDTEYAFRCDEVPEQRCGYALNGNLIGKHDASSARTVVLFDSDVGWNGVGGPQQLALPPRHPGGVAVCYADGTVAVVPESELGQLIWQ